MPPYTATGRWFPEEWFAEMGVPFTHPDPTQIEIANESTAQLALSLLREEAARVERVRAIEEAEAERLRELAARPPLIDRILAAFQDTMFRAISIPVFRQELAVVMAIPGIVEEVITQEAAVIAHLAPPPPRLMPPPPTDVPAFMQAAPAIPSDHEVSDDESDWDDPPPRRPRAVPEGMQPEPDDARTVEAYIAAEVEPQPVAFTHAEIAAAAYTPTTLGGVMLQAEAVAANRLGNDPVEVTEAWIDEEADAIIATLREEAPEYLRDPEQYEITPGYIQVLNTRTNQVLSIKSDEYEIVNDEDVCRRAALLFEAANVHIEPCFHHVTVGKDGVSGRSTYMEFSLPEFTILPDSADAHDMKVVVSNSFDGTKKERLIVLLRSCTSGSYVLGFSQHESFAIRHRTGANERLVTQFGTFMHDSVAHNAACIRLLEQNDADTPDQVAVYLNDNRILSGERNAEKLMGRWMVQGTPTNFWSIYQMFAGIITDEYGQNFGAKLEKMMQLNSEVRRTWPEAMGMVQMPVI